MNPRIAPLFAVFLAATSPLCAKDAPKPEAKDPSKPAAIPTGESDYELRGFFGSGEQLEVSLTHKGETAAQWYKVGEKNRDILVESADAVAGTVQIVAGGVRSALKLIDASAPEKATLQIAKKAVSDDEIRAGLQSFRTYVQSMSLEQQLTMLRVLRENSPSSFEEPRAESGTNSNSPPAPEKPRRSFFDLLSPAIQAAAGLPGKNGRVAPAPADVMKLIALPLERLGKIMLETH